MHHGNSSQAETSDTRGLIFDIQGHSVADGPGTRTLVFMSGCPLRCKWCSNPEGQLLHPRPMYRTQLCERCPFRCVEACPYGAARRSGNANPPVLFDRDVCDRCDSMECIRVCYRQALQRSGKWYTVGELMRLLNRDRSYWTSEGGITFTGGEPLLQQPFLLNVLHDCDQACISACIETSAYIAWSVLASVLPFIEWLFIDIKHMDSGKHANATGVPNEPILENIRHVASTVKRPRTIIRVPVIPGYNDTIDNMEATARFVRGVGLSEINLLPFHGFGASKYEQLGLPCSYAENPPPSVESLERLVSACRTQGVSCYLGPDTPF